MFERLGQLVERIWAYSLWQVLLELGIIWIVVYVVIRFVQGTRAIGALKGVLLVLVTATLLIRILGGYEAFQRLRYLYENFVTLLAITLVVVFQPELRRGLIRLGEAPVFRRAASGAASTAGAIADACAYLSKAKFGALIVLERENALKGLVEGGTNLNAIVTARLLQTIFFPGSALHDLAVVIKGDRIDAAGVQLPLAEPEEMPDATLGSRHRAAVGLSKECDAVVVVVSEETGMISISERGRLVRGLTPSQLREAIERRMAGRSMPELGLHDVGSDPGASDEPAHAPDASDEPGANGVPAGVAGGRAGMAGHTGSGRNVGGGGAGAGGGVSDA